MFGISQNCTSSLVSSMYDEFDKHFNNLGINCSDYLKYKVVTDTCECEIETVTDLIFNLEKSDEWIFDKDTTNKFLDEYMLNEFYYYELPKEFVLSEIKFLKKLELYFKSVCINIDIKRTQIRYNPFIRNKQIKYRINVTYVFK